mmetsp:Transcript_46683/g.123345  ORF Transcript_46683/g.123345 Transcript_46683/m.123345 type:complete len:250 (+) Transcript_46683:1316-2065(+)
MKADVRITHRIRRRCAGVIRLPILYRHPGTRHQGHHMTAQLADLLPRGSQVCACSGSPLRQLCRDFIVPLRPGGARACRGWSPWSKSRCLLGFGIMHPCVVYVASSETSCGPVRPRDVGATWANTGRLKGKMLLRRNVRGCARSSRVAEPNTCIVGTPWTAGKTLLSRSGLAVSAALRLNSLHGGFGRFLGSWTFWVDCPRGTRTTTKNTRVVGHVHAAACWKAPSSFTFHNARQNINHGDDHSNKLRP